MTPKCSQGRNGHQGHHPNDETVPMDVDPPVFTRVNRAYTNEDKDCYMEQGLALSVERKDIKHVNVLIKRNNPSSQLSILRRELSLPVQRSYPPKRTQGFRKSNKPKGYFNMNVRVASIEEVSNDEKDNEDKEIPFLAARTA